MKKPDTVLKLKKLVGSSHLKVNFRPIESDEKAVSALICVSVHTHVYDMFRLSERSSPWMSSNTNSRHISESADFLKTMQAHGYDRFITAIVSSLVCCRQGYDPFAAHNLLMNTCLSLSRHPVLMRVNLSINHILGIPLLLVQNQNSFQSSIRMAPRGRKI